MSVIDAWVRRRVLTSEIFPAEFRVGKIVVDAIIALSNKITAA